jgi:hypothetical protein
MGYARLARSLGNSVSRRKDRSPENSPPGVSDCGVFSNYAVAARFTPLLYDLCSGTRMPNSLQLPVPIFILSGARQRA